MGAIEDRWRSSVSRRRALAGLVSMFASGAVLRAQRDPRPLSEHRRVLGLDEMQTAFDFQDVFFRNLPQSTIDNTDHGVESEWNMRRNREAFEWVDIVNRPEVQVAADGTATELFGFPMKFPILVAPTAGQVGLHPQGESGMHIGATNANTTMLISVFASQPIEKIAAAAKGPVWYQYTPRHEPQEMLMRAQNAGCPVMAMTVDNRALYFERDLHSRHLGGNPRRPGRAVTGSGDSDVMESLRRQRHHGPRYYVEARR